VRALTRRSMVLFGSILLLCLTGWLYWPFFSGLHGAERIEDRLIKAPIQIPSLDDYAQVLSALVTPDGRVAYDRMTPELHQSLNQFLKEIATATPAKYPRENQRMAFYINAYNALVLSGVLKRMPLTSVKDTGPLNRFFRTRDYVVANVRVSLHGFETKIIRRYNPLMHFGLNCASISCPPLQAKPFHPNSLIPQLEEAATQFLADPRFNYFDPSTGVLYLSKIFDWYRDDFGGEQGVRHFIATYGPSQWPQNTPLNFLPYDWGLNAPIP